jgi:hypothetical protein
MMVPLLMVSLPRGNTPTWVLVPVISSELFKPINAAQFQLSLCDVGSFLLIAYTIPAAL